MEFVIVVGFRVVQRVTTALNLPAGYPHGPLSATSSSDSQTTRID